MYMTVLQDTAGQGEAAIEAAPTLDFDNLLIDNMASSIDAVIPDGDIETRLQDLKNVIRTRAKYELTRRAK